MESNQTIIKIAMHVGSLIRKVVDEQGRNIKWLAEKLNCDRTNIYKIFNRENIDTNLLNRFCEILDHNFFLDLSNEIHLSPNPPQIVE